MINKREYPRDMSFIDKQGNTIHPCREDYNSRKSTKKIGEAYAFFNCKASKKEIKKELPKIRNIAQTPSQLELSLTEGITISDFDNPELKEIAYSAKEAGINYFMKASYKDMSHYQTAGELTSILNQAYQSPLYQDNEGFRGKVFYKKKGHYVEKE